MSKQPEAQTTKSRTLKSVLKRLSIILTAAAASIAIVYWYVTPTHEDASKSVQTLLQAINQQDLATASAYANLDAIATSIVNQLYQENTHPKQNPLGASLHAMVKPSLRQKLATEMTHFIATGKPSPKGFIHTTFALAGPPEKMILKEIKPVKTQQKQSNITITWHNTLLESDISLSLVLHQTPKGSWKVTGIKNLKPLAKQVEALKNKAIEAHNNKVRAQISTHIKAGEVQKSTGLSQWSGGKSILVRVPFHNIGPQDITNFHANIYFSQQDGSFIKAISFQEDDYLPAGSVVEKSRPFNLDRNKKADKQLLELNNKDLQTDVDITRLQLADGTILEVQSP